MWIKWSFFLSCLESKNIQTHSTFDSYFTRARGVANREEAKLVDLLRLFLALSLFPRGLEISEVHPSKERKKDEFREYVRFEFRTP